MATNADETPLTAAGLSALEAHARLAQFGPNEPAATTHYSPVAASSRGAAVWEFTINHETSRIREEIAALECTGLSVLRVLPMALALQS